MVLAVHLWEFIDRDALHRQKHTRTQKSHHIRVNKLRVRMCAASAHARVQSAAGGSLAQGVLTS